VREILKACLDACAEVERRGNTPLKIALNGLRHLLDIALNHLTLAGDFPDRIRYRGLANRGFAGAGMIELGSAADGAYGQPWGFGPPPVQLSNSRAPSDILRTSSVFGRDLVA
jgi:hypothetical protein